MDLLSIFKKQEEIVLVVEPAPIEMCPAGDHELIKVNQNDGVYCGECGELLSQWVALPVKVERASWESSDLPQKYEFKCPRCKYNNKDSRVFDEDGEELTDSCSDCQAVLQAPAGFCPSCWGKLANNGRCIQKGCGRYQKPEQARFVPVYEIRVPSPHCGNCGQPFVVLNREAGNEKAAEITLGPGGYEWISAKKGCSQCGAPFEKTNEKPKKK